MHPTFRVGIATAAVFLALQLAGCTCTKPDGAQPVLSGAELFRACTACHGHNGEGNPTIQAPTIAGLPEWYVQAQLHKFRTGLRGAHPDDYEGLRMRPMSRQLYNQAEVDQVAKYISSMPAQKAAHGLEGGDAQAGTAGYAICVACHGDKGQGNPTVHGPPLTTQPDWYLFAQLKKFKAGIRGQPSDSVGSTMRAMSLTIPDEKAMKNVVAYIGTFNH
jgi:cytochrome c553